jgi:ABC-type uncharacterized transport system auxiliary subunit
LLTGLQKAPQQLLLAVLLVAALAACTHAQGAVNVASTPGDEEAGEAQLWQLQELQLRSATADAASKANVSTSSTIPFELLCRA